MRIFVKVLCAFAVVIVAVYAGRHFLIATTLETVLYKQTGEKPHFKSRTWDNGNLIYQDFSLGKTFKTNKLEIEFQFHLLKVDSKIRLTGLEIELQKDDSVFNLGFLVPTRFWTIKLGVENGVLKTKQESYPFYFVSGFSDHDIGKITIDDFLTCDFSTLQNSLSVDLQIENGSVSKLLPLAACFYSIPSWSKVEGSVSAHLKGTAGHSIQGNVNLKEMKWESEEIICAADSIQGEVDFKNELEGLFLQFQGCDLFWKELEVVRAHGRLGFHKGEVPTFVAKADVHIAQVEGKAEIEGKGELHKDQTLWMEGKVQYATESETPLEVTFSLADDGKTQVLHTDVSHLGKEILALVPEMKITQGILEAKATTFFQNWKGKTVEIETFQVNQLEIPHLFAPTVQGKGIWNLETGLVQQLNLQVYQAKAHYQAWEATEIDAHLAVVDQCFEPSHAVGKVQGISTEVEFQGPLHALHANMRCTGGASEWLQKEKNALESPIVLEMAFDRDRDEISAQGTVTCLNDTVHIQTKGHLFTGVWKGNFESKNIQTSSYAPVLKIFMPTVQLDGNFQCKGDFTHNTLDVIVQGHDVLCKHPNFEARSIAPEFFYHFNFEQKEGSGKGQIADIQLKTALFPLEVKLVSGDLTWDAASLSCTNLKSQIQGMEMEGDLHVHFHKDLQADFIAQKVKGSVQDLKTAIAHFHEIPVQVNNLQGSFECLSEGLQLFWDKEKLHYRIKARFQDIAGPITGHFGLHQTSFGLSYDTLENHWVIENIQGFLGLSQENIAFSSRRISLKDREWIFDGAFSKETPLLNFQGKALEKDGGFAFHLDEAVASSSYLKTPLTFFWDKKKIDHLEGTMYLDTGGLKEQLSLLEKCGFIELSQQIKEFLSHLQGGLSVQFIVDGTDSEYEFKSSGLHFAKTHIHTLQGHLVKHGGEWTLKKGVLNAMQLQGKVLQKNEKWVFPTLDVIWKKLNLHLAGVYQKNVFDFVVDGLFMSRFSLQGAALLDLSKAQFQNIALEVLEGNQNLASFNCDALIYRNEKWETSALQTTLFSRYLKQPLRTRLHFSWGDSITFQGLVSQGETDIGDSVLKIGQIFGLYQSPYIQLKCATTLDGNPLEVVAKFSDEAPFGGGIHLQQGKETLKVVCSDPTTIQKLEGNLLGMSMHLHREDGSYKGKIRIKDGNKIADLFSQSHLRSLRGIDLSGIWSDNFDFRGDLAGHECCIEDYILQDVQAHIDYTPSRFKLTQVTLTDPAGTLFVKECFGKKVDEDWLFSIPLLKGQELKPSLLRKKHTKTKEAKPFLIRHLVLSEVTGKLGDLKSIYGSGSIHFTQRIKKEPSVFDIPMTFLKDLGLDLDLFTPVNGEAHLQLKDGKVFFTELSNTFSEGKRSEFYLADHFPSYIKFDGELFLNLRMQQNVVLKLAEPFTIAVRGTWEKPKYSLQ